MSLSNKRARYERGLAGLQVSNQNDIQRAYEEVCTCIQALLKDDWLTSSTNGKQDSPAIHTEEHLTKGMDKWAKPRSIASLGAYTYRL